ncbi:hypothetical protein H2200_009206 [Cladophialophora chaetospira]|uniref:Glycosyl transferase family 25 domain-containing protein n=1 Tax=Cladophialophora chaetospira TaxID=386627 RepID=A0AA38X407_9EURO|nr:hypothetical protein H2200_009206 [Cladophialophora chaetospira]
MTRRFWMAGLAVTLVTTTILFSQFKSEFPDFDGPVFRYGDRIMSEYRTGPVVKDLPGIGNLTDAMNSTLGFGKVFVVSMPDRTDKRDAFSLQARVSNITFEFRDGVAGEDVSKKALPLWFNQDPGATGCWRAHLNVLQEMIRDNIQTALVFEDDADWDVAIKYQALQAARATRFITHQQKEGGTLSPYGDDWDMMWLGHCAAEPDPINDRRFVVENDPTVTPPWKRFEVYGTDISPFQEPSVDFADYRTRVWFRMKFGFCTAAYGISLRGAEKVVFTESMVPFNTQVDSGMGIMCKDHILNFTCISPYPTVVGVSKPAGAANRGSDIRDLEDETINEEGWSDRVVFSTRQNIPRILTGKDGFSSVFEDDERGPTRLEDIATGVGHEEWIWNGERYLSEGEYQAARDQTANKAEAPKT